jgi:hypothetical protein
LSWKYLQRESRIVAEKTQAPKEKGGEIRALSPPLHQPIPILRRKMRQPPPAAPGENASKGRINSEVNRLGHNRLLLADYCQK